MSGDRPRDPVDGALPGDRAEELLGAYVLDALDDARDRQEVDALLARSPDARQEVARLTEVAALLAPGDDAPSDSWQRLAGALDDDAPALDVDALRARRARRSTARVPLLAAAVLALVVAVAGLLTGLALGDRSDEPDDLAALADAAQGDPGARVVTLDAGDGAVAARVVSLPDGSGFFLPADLAALPSGTYQLWALTASGDAVSLGVLGREPVPTAFRAPTDGVAGFAVSAEAAPAAAPTLPPVASGTLS